MNRVNKMVRDKTIQFKGQDIKASDLYAILKAMNIDAKDIHEKLEYEGYNPLINPFIEVKDD